MTNAGQTALVVDQLQAMGATGSDLMVAWAARRKPDPRSTQEAELMLRARADRAKARTRSWAALVMPLDVMRIDIGARRSLDCRVECRLAHFGE